MSTYPFEMHVQRLGRDDAPDCPQLGTACQKSQANSLNQAIGKQSLQCNPENILLAGIADPHAGQASIGEYQAEGQAGNLSLAGINHSNDLSRAEDANDARRPLLRCR
jgi:hypothetical protein